MIFSCHADEHVFKNDQIGERNVTQYKRNSWDFTSQFVRTVVFHKRTAGSNPDNVPAITTEIYGCKECESVDHTLTYERNEYGNTNVTPYEPFFVNGTKRKHPNSHNNSATGSKRVSNKYVKVSQTLCDKDHPNPKRIEYSLTFFVLKTLKVS